MPKEKVYADKFFDKKMKPGMMGDGFLYLNQEGRKKKVKPLFPTTDEILESK